MAGELVSFSLVALVDDVESRTGTLLPSLILAPGMHRIVPAVPVATEQMKGLQLWGCGARGTCF